VEGYQKENPSKLVTHRVLWQGM